VAKNAAGRSLLWHGINKNNEPREGDAPLDPPQRLSLRFNRLICKSKNSETFCTATHFLCQEANLATSSTRCSQTYPQSLGIFRKQS
jgi:hypothetical protein